MSTRLPKQQYNRAIEELQHELNDLAHWLAHTGRRMAVIFEGRDTAGKGGTINAITERLNPRQIRIVALAKPTERERTQNYFQRYAAHLPAAGELVLFDRSWYNRAGVEHVMGFCSREEYRLFLKQVPVFEKLLVDDGLLLFKYWLCVDQEQQEERLAERAVDPLKRWKLSPVDLAARLQYAEYGKARDVMLEASHTAHAPWTLVNFNDQRRGRLNLIRDLLDRSPHVPLRDPEVELPPLPGSPARERYRGPVRPIRGRW